MRTTDCVCAVVRRGTIVEEGSHRELVRIPDGAYATLVRLQQQRAAAGDQDADSLVRRAAPSECPVHCPLMWRVRSKVSV